MRYTAQPGHVHIHLSSTAIMSTANQVLRSSILVLCGTEVSVQVMQGFTLVLCCLVFLVAVGSAATRNSLSNTATCRSSSMACQLVCKSAKTTCTDDAASRWQVAVSCLSQLTATQLVETCIACRMHEQLHSEMQFLKVTTFVPNFFPSLSYAGREKSS